MSVQQETLVGLVEFAVTLMGPTLATVSVVISSLGQELVPHAKVYHVPLLR